MKRNTLVRTLAGIAIACLFGGVSSHRAHADNAVSAASASSSASAPAPREPRKPDVSDLIASDAITGLDFDDARRDLAAADADDPVVAFEKARLALYEEDCDGALALLARPEIAHTDAGVSLADIARGCARTIASTVVDRDDANAVEVRYEDELDRSMTPLLVETVVKARDALTRDLGVTWPKPTRIVVVRDLIALASMTGLPYASAQTTGTVAVAKWGRVTILSPRASRHGYPWRDTVAHELTHLALTRATVDRAPLWLQEGVAKNEEIRWREPGPFDSRPSPEAIVQRGTELGLAIPLDKLGPSIAMLPSADAAMVAFAEVTSFVKYLNEKSSPDVLPKLLLEIRRKKTIDEALTDAAGGSLAQLDAKWRATIHSEAHEALPLILQLGVDSAKGREGLRELRERARLAELLVGRGHDAAAITELDHVTTHDAEEDASLRYIRARALEGLGKGDPKRQTEAEAQVADPRVVLSSYAPWWAIRGRFALAHGDTERADISFHEALGQDPFDVEAACRSLDPNAAPPDRTRDLCEAARHAGDPDLGND